MKLENLLISFIKEAPFNRKKLASLCGVHENYLANNFLIERGLPKIHLYSILEVCVKYGFNINGSQVICLPETQVDKISKNEKDFITKIDRGIYFLDTNSMNYE